MPSGSPLRARSCSASTSSAADDSASASSSISIASRLVYIAEGRAPTVPGLGVGRKEDQSPDFHVLV
eukprot:937961-Prymnesium_polylepis.2